MRRYLPPGMKFGKYRSWKKANERRGILIEKKCMRPKSMTAAEEKEYAVLDKMADRIAGYNSRGMMRNLRKVEKWIAEAKRRCKK